MKKLLVLVLSLVLCGMAFTMAHADTDSDAIANVYVRVDPNITLRAPAASVSAGTVQTGQVFASIVFRVDANKEDVNFRVVASDLFKGDDPVNPAVPPIALDTTKPAEITAPDANESAAGDNKAPWDGTGDNIGNYPTKKTVNVNYESSQSGHFSQDVTVKLYWLQPDPEKPMGQYSGKVKLVAFLTGI